MSEKLKQAELPDSDKLIKDAQKTWQNHVEVLPTGRKRVHRVKRPLNKK